MIDFSCTCGNYKFSLPDDMAGGMIQCPRCRRLNDVPVPSDVAMFDEDGAYKLDDEPAADFAKQGVDKLSRIYSRQRTNQDGSDVDLRNKPEEFANVGGESIAVTDDAIVHDSPKYDPFTGELIRPVVVKESAPSAAAKVVDPKTMPLGQRSASRIRREEAEQPNAAAQFAIPFKLLTPVNVLVMIIIFSAHLFSQALMFVVGLGFLMVGLAFPILQALFLSHYGNVIDEMGPTRNSELPAPLRSVSWVEDIGGPFLHMFLALAICYGPAVFVLLLGLPWKIALPLSGILALAGTPFVPAMMLTAMTSGTWMNLRPDRVMSVITASTGEYLLPVILWTIAAPLYLVSTSLLYLNALSLGLRLLAVGVQLPEGITDITTSGVGKYTSHAPSIIWSAEYLALAGAVFATHWMCWSLGLIYRRHHEQFDWLFQRHERKNTDTLPPVKPPISANRNSEAAKKKLATDGAQMHRESRIKSTRRPS